MALDFGTTDTIEIHNHYPESCTGYHGVFDGKFYPQCPIVDFICTCGKLMVVSGTGWEEKDEV